MYIDRKIEAMRERLERSRPARMTVTLADGKVIYTDPVGAIRLFQDSEIGEIADVATDRADYMGLAGMLAALCR